MPDNVKLSLWDATYHEIQTDCVLKSIDWRFLCQNFMNLGQLVWILHYFKENTSYLPQTTFSLEMKELGIFTVLSFCNILIYVHKVDPEWKMNWPTYEPLSNHLSFWTYFVFPAQNNEKKRFKFKCADNFYRKFWYWEKISFYFKSL